MRIEILNKLEELTPYARQWNELAFAAPQKLACLTHAWISAYVEHRLQERERFRCVLALEGDTLIGVLPVVLTEYHRFGFKHVVARTPYDEHTFSCDMLVLEGREREVLPALVAGLDRVEKTRLVLVLRHLVECSPSLRYLKSGVPGHVTVREFDGRGSVFIPDHSFEKFFASLKSKFRTQLRRGEKRLLADGQLSFETYDNTESAMENLDRFIRLESSGWKGEMGTAIGQSSELTAFYRSLVKRLSEIGCLEFQFLEIGGKDVAGQIVPKVGRHHTAFKIGHDEKYKASSPGMVLILRSIQSAYATDFVISINWLTDLPWHRSWNVSKIDYYNLYLYPRRILPMLTGYLPAAAKNRLRRMPLLLSIYHKLQSKNGHSSGTGK